MGKKQREVQEINASSMADISFLLLVFFLVTTSMSTDEGLSRNLPRMKEKQKDEPKTEVKPRNLMEILVNSNNELMVNGEVMDVKQLRTEAKKFIKSNPNDEKLPEGEYKNIDKIGNVFVATAHIISMQNDRGTEYDKYIEVQNELVAAYNELRDEVAKKAFRKPYSELSKEDQDLVREAVPQVLSEAEPKTYGGN